MIVFQQSFLRLCQTFKKWHKSGGLIFLLPDILLAKSSHYWMQMGGGHFCFILGGAIALPPIGYLCDRYGQKNIIICALFSSLTFLYLLTSMTSMSAFLGCLLLFFLGASLNSINPMIVSWGHKVTPSNPSTVSALLMGFAWCFSHFGPLGAGVLYKTFSEQKEIKTLLCLSILLIFSLGFTLLTPSKESTIQEAKATS